MFDRVLNTPLYNIAKTPADTGRKVNVHTFRRLPGPLLNVLCTFNLRPVSTGKSANLVISQRISQKRFYRASLGNLNH